MGRLYKNSRNSLSGLPIWLEKIFIKLSFLSSCKIITSKNWKTYITWLSSKPYYRKKLVVLDLLVDELPTPEFFETLQRQTEIDRAENILLYVGRLHREKLVEDIVKAFVLVKKVFPNVRLIIVGDGPEKKKLVTLANSLGVGKNISFEGFKPNHELVLYYKKATIFVSPVTGTALREAALCGCPIVAYPTDWVGNIFKNGEEILFAKTSDVRDLAEKICFLLKNKKIRYEMSLKISKVAKEIWNPEKLTEQLKNLITD